MTDSAFGIFSFQHTFSQLSFQSMQNILMSGPEEDNVLKIADFGLSRYVLVLAMLHFISYVFS